MIGIFKKIFGKENFKLKIEEINNLESDFAKLKSEELKSKSLDLKKIIASGASLDSIMVEAFALVREAARRTLGQRHYDVQLTAGAALHQGKIVEMMTGEGKTLAATAPAYLNSLSGKGVHVITVNDYLASRDAVWMGQIYYALGLSVGCLTHDSAYIYDPNYKIEKPLEDENKLDKERDILGSFKVVHEYLRPISRKEAYACDILYGTNHEFGFDYLRDNLTYSLNQQVQRKHYFAIIDEVDSILIDEARTPLIIAAPDAESSEYYKIFSKIAGQLKKEEDYFVDEKLKSVSISELGIDNVEKALRIKNIYAPENLRLVHYLEESLRAYALFEKDKNYVVKNGEIIIVDEFTGRLMHGRRYSGGLHQAIEAKEGVQIKQESRTFAKITIQNYFRLYEKIAGMTGTAQTSAEEFHKVYNLEVVSILPNKPMIRRDLADAIYKNTSAKYKAAAEEIKKRHINGQPVLVGTASINHNEILSNLLKQFGIPHEVLNAKNHEREGAIIAQAGKSGAVTVATNMAGRGVDIILGGNPPDKDETQKIKELGGLCVIGTERHEARRIDNQLRGRSGRQGDPGASQFILSLEDDLLRIFGGEKIKSLMESFNLPEDQPIESRLVSKVINEAQKKVEGFNFDSRKHLLDYDDVLNKQRKAIYAKRQEILEVIDEENKEKNLSDAIKDIVADIAEEKINKLKVLDKDFKKQISFALLSVLDALWMSHLENMEALTESVRLRAYGQHDPLVEYRREGHKLFKELFINFENYIRDNIDNMIQTSQGNIREIKTENQNHAISQSSSFANVGRNDPCPCGSGKKYKKCHGE
ncbi:MAG: preprotein translocase subunit SecA [Patescibacteria group bacterium]|mgnify:CR=1 FL=1